MLAVKRKTEIFRLKKWPSHIFLKYLQWQRGQLAQR